MKIIKLIFCLSLISAICAGVLASINEVTKEAIKQIAAKRTLDAAAAVMPPSVDKSKVEELKGSDGIFVGKDATGKIAGYAIKGSDPSGYGGEIVLMVGFTPDCRISTYQKLVAMETPGLGTQLSSPAFMKQFEGLDASSPISVKKDGGTIEAITSATITSRAVCGAINNAKKKMEGIKK